MLRRAALYLALLTVCTLVAPGCLQASRMYTKAPQAIVLELSSNAVLFEHDADVTSPPASMSKLMTLYIVFQHLKEGRIAMEDEFQVSEDACCQEGSSIFLKPGQVVKVSDLIKGVAVASGNDACIVLAEGIWGSQSRFIQEMNGLAQSLGLTNSKFTSVTGWADGEHTMSVRDIAILSARIVKDFPEYYYIFSERQFTYNGVTQKNFNTLLNYGIGVDGIKTGHTERGGYGMVASAQKGDRRVFVVVNGLKTETERAYETKKLILYAFSHFKTKTFFPSGSSVGEVEIREGNHTVTSVHVRDNVIITYPKGIQESNVKVLLSHKSPVLAPVEKGQEIGTLIVRVPGVPDYSFPVYASRSVKELGRVGKFMRSLKNYFAKNK